MTTERAEAVLQTAPVGRLGLNLAGESYVVPLNFAYLEGNIYFHCAKVGKKVEMMRENPAVCFEVDRMIGIKEGDIACAYSCYYESVIGWGDAEFLMTTEEERAALDLIMKKYAPGHSPSYSEKSLDEVAVVKIPLTRMTGKAYDPQ